MGLDEPIPIQYLRWAGKVVRGDFGISIRNQTPIGETIGVKILPTAELALLAAIISILIALPAGIISALRPNSLADAGATLAALSGVAVPHFFLGVLLIYAFAVGLRILPPVGLRRAVGGSRPEPQADDHAGASPSAPAWPRS